MTKSNRPQTPAQAWAAMLEGNQRFVTDTPSHERQDSGIRQELAKSKNLSLLYLVAQIQGLRLKSFLMLA